MSYITWKNGHFITKILGKTDKMSEKYIGKTDILRLYKKDIAKYDPKEKLFLDDIQIKILSREKNINFGAVYENAVAQELHSHGYELYYFNSKKQGELDFIIEDKGEIVPIEIKSGKDYTAHSALNRVIANEQYQISRAFVFCNENVHVKGKVVYCPIYMIMFLKKENETEKMIYTPDFSILQ